MNVICNICKSDQVKLKIVTFGSHGRDIINANDKYQLYECENCASNFLSIKVDKSYYKRSYGFENYYTEAGQGFISNLLTKFYFFLKEKLILKQIKMKHKNKIHVLDVGSGNGDFLLNLSNGRFIKSGVEINKTGADISKSKGLKIYNDRIENIDFKNQKFDVIMMWHVLEHIDNPAAAFFKMNECLKDEGVLIFQVPNSNGLGFKLGKKYWFHLDSPRHLWIPNIKSVKYLCNQTGFDIIKIKNEFYDYPLDLFWSVRKSWAKYIIYPLYPFFKLFSREHLTFICKKK